VDTKRFPEIAKAVGHKYVRRVAKPGGGYRYIYKEPKSEEEKKRTETWKKLDRVAERLVDMYRVAPEMAKEVLNSIYTKDEVDRVVGMIGTKLKLRRMVGKK
jgi:hypothetical protein